MCKERYNGSNRVIHLNGPCRAGRRAAAAAQAWPATMGRAGLAHPYAGRAVLGTGQIVPCLVPPVWPSPFGHLYLQVL
jgi:hypothetical protein